MSISANIPTTGITLSQIVPWGRSLPEYISMFALTQSELTSLAILGVGDGPASFNAEATKTHHSRIVSVDPLYQFTTSQIEARVNETRDEILSKVKASMHSYVWDTSTFATPEQMCKYRLDTMTTFLNDYELGLAQHRYMNQSLPSLRFKDNEFDLALCSHLLFLYSDHLSYEMHVKGIREMMRVAKEARVFPITTLFCEVSGYVERVKRELEEDGFQVGIERVAYEFQKGGNQMMRIRQI